MFHKSCLANNLLLTLGSTACYLLSSLVFSFRTNYIVSSSRRMSTIMKLNALSWSDLRWIDLQIPPDQLRPCNTLTMGQCFNWYPIPVEVCESCEGLWVGVLNDMPLAIKQLPHTTEVTLLYKNFQKNESMLKETTIFDQIRSYFQVDDSLKDLYELWATKCPRMKVIAERIPGVRVVRQDPWECLISFICSSNNNIQRIGGMLQRLRAKYGQYLCSVVLREDGNIFILYNEAQALQFGSDHTPKKRKRVSDDTKPETGGTSGKVVNLYSFPTVQALAAAKEEDFRSLGMGYRAKFIHGTAILVQDKQKSSGSEVSWLESLRHPSDASTSEERRLLVQSVLLECPGVGRKVADCVALFSLDQSEAIPVDTHVWDIAVRDYDSSLVDSKSLTPRVYESVGDVFRRLFTHRAGWAHSVLFAAELPAFRSSLPDDLVEGMKSFIDAKKQKKANKVKKDQ